MLLGADSDADATGRVEEIDANRKREATAGTHTRCASAVVSALIATTVVAIITHCADITVFAADAAQRGVLAARCGVAGYAFARIASIADFVGAFDTDAALADIGGAVVTDLAARTVEVVMDTANSRLASVGGAGVVVVTVLLGPDTFAFDTDGVLGANVPVVTRAGVVGEEAAVGLGITDIVGAGVSIETEPVVDNPGAVIVETVA